MANRLELVRGAYGAILLIVPRGVANHVLHMDATPGFLTLLKVLGVRQIAQAAVMAPSIANRLHPLGAAVDVLHALSMIAAGAASRTYRRAALVDAVMAGTFATLESRNQHVRVWPHRCIQG